MNTPALTQLNPMLCQRQRLSNPYRLRLGQWPGNDRTPPSFEARAIRLRLAPGGRGLAATEAGVGPGTRGWFHAVFAAFCLSAAMGLVAAHEIQYRRAAYQAAMSARQDKESLRQERQKYLALAAEVNAQWARQGAAGPPRMQPVGVVAAARAESTRM